MPAVANVMSGPDSPRGALDRDTLRRLFDELADELARVQARAHVYIVGGAAMMLAYQRDRTTHDGDARIDDGHAAVLAAVETIARRHGLATTWLNEQAAEYLPATPDRRAPVVYDSPHLVITGASAEHLLAMKLEAARRTDEADVVALLRTLDIQDSDTAIAIHASLFPDSRQTGRARALNEAALRDAARREAACSPGC